MSGNIPDSVRFRAASATLRTHIAAAGQFGSCALAKGRYTAKTQGNLVVYARAIGFTQIEAYGIMDGWDVASGSYARHLAVFERMAHDHAYREAHNLGASLYKEFGNG